MEETFGGEIDDLVARYELSSAAADGLRNLVRLIDWEEPNFVPKAGLRPRGSERRPPRTPSKDRVSSTLSESLAGLDLEPVREAGQVADIGSGGGFPGLVLAIALPHTRVALLEKVDWKCEFLRRATMELGLDNVEVVEGNVQEWSDGVGACDVVTSRKAGRPNTIVEWSAPLLAPGGAIVLWQGARDQAKEALAAEAAAATGLGLETVHELPSEKRKRKTVEKHLYVYRKLDGESPSK